MKKIILLGTFLVSTLANALNFSVYPTRFEAVGNKITTEELTVTNNTLQPLRIEIFASEDEEYGKEYNLNSNITIFPKNISIKPGASQKVRFRIKPDERLKDGEFKSNLTFKEIPYEIKSTATEEKKADEIVSNLQFITEVLIPVYSYGENIKLDGELKNLKTTYMSESLNLKCKTISKGTASIQFYYEIDVAGDKYSGKIGNSARVGEKELNISIPLKKGLKGKKANLKIFDQQGKEYYKSMISL